jgi:hypothetical protein
MASEATLRITLSYAHSEDEGPDAVDAIAAARATLSGQATGSRKTRIGRS